MGEYLCWQRRERHSHSTALVLAEMVLASASAVNPPDLRFEHWMSCRRPTKLNFVQNSNSARLNSRRFCFEENHTTYRTRRQISRSSYCRHQKLQRMEQGLERRRNEERTTALSTEGEGQEKLKMKENDTRVREKRRAFLKTSRSESDQPQTK